MENSILLTLSYVRMSKRTDLYIYRLCFEKESVLMFLFHEFKLN